MWHDRLADTPHNHYTSLDHTSPHKVTNHILHPSPAPCLQSPGALGKTLHRWCGIVPVSPTGTVTTGSFPGYCVLVWRIEQGSCGQACLQSESQRIPTILKNYNNFNKSNNTNNTNKLESNESNNDNNYHSQDCGLFPASTQGPCVSLCRRWEKERNLRLNISNRIWRDHKTSMINTAESSRASISDCRKKVSQGRGCIDPLIWILVNLRHRRFDLRHRIIPMWRTTS